MPATPTAQRNHLREGTDPTVEGEITPTVRFVRGLIAVLVLAAVAAGVFRGVTGGGSATHGALAGLYAVQTALAAILILLGSIVEGFGFGLSLGTRWPYTRNIFLLMVRGDPEATHRITATLVGLIGVALVILAPNATTISGLGLIIVAALLGIGTLYVLAGRMPAFVHGLHGLVAYGVYLCYMSELFAHGNNFWSYLTTTKALFAVLVAVFLGGMTTGQRGFGRSIGAFSFPHLTPQWVMIIHLAAALSVIAVLGSLMPAYPAAFYLAVAQVVVGFLLFHAVNLKPRNPGILVAIHQGMAMLIALAIVAA